MEIFELLGCCQSVRLELEGDTASSLFDVLHLFPPSFLPFWGRVHPKTWVVPYSGVNWVF